MGLRLISKAATVPIALADAKALCRIEGARFDAELGLLMASAAASLGEWAGISLGEQTWELTLDAFSDAIELPRGPVLTVPAATFTYFDEFGESQQVDPAVYALDLTSDPQWVMRNSDQAWPAVLDAGNVVKLRFTTGFTAETLPDGLRSALLALVKVWFEQGIEIGIPQAVMDQAAPWRMLWICA